MSNAVDFVDELLIAGVDLNATDCRKVREVFDRWRLALSPEAPKPAEAATCDVCGGSDSPSDVAGPNYKAPWPCYKCGRRRCCPESCPTCSPAEQEGGNR